MGPEAPYDIRWTTKRIRVFGVAAIRPPGRRLVFYVDSVFVVVQKHVYVHSHVGGGRGDSDVSSFVGRR